MRRHAVALLASLAAGIALPGDLQAGSITSIGKSQTMSVTDYNDFKLVAGRKYKRLKPGCRAAFCKPGYKYGKYKKWKRRRDFGRAIIGTVVIGAAIATAANTIPRRPSSDVCWVWTNNARTRGYWDYCY